MVLSSVLGFPHIGTNREVTKAVEAYWEKKISEEELQKDAADIRKANWLSLKMRRVDLIPSGDFSLYDHVLDHSVAFNVIPERYVRPGLSELDTFFAMGHGRQSGDIDVPACEMKQWFDTNYHYAVPELSDETEFKLLYNKPLREFDEAKALGVTTRPVVLGPISYLLLGKASEGAPADFMPVSLLSKLLPIYETLLSQLKVAGVESVQIDEPILVLEAAKDLEKEYAATYAQLAQVAPKIVLTTYFARLDSNINFIAKLPIAGLHIDLCHAPEQLDKVIPVIKSTPLILSLGVVSGRNIWKTDFSSTISKTQMAITALGKDRVIVATSCSLLHTPVTLANESNLTAEQQDWFSFALEKAEEVAAITAFFTLPQDLQAANALERNKESISKRREFERKSANDALRQRIATITPDMCNRKGPFIVRQKAHTEKLQLVKFPTTTVDSFPQTQDIRDARANLGNGGISLEEYEGFMKTVIKDIILFQERVGLDILVHGEPERNDLIQYFGERLNGFVTTEHAWVQSYGPYCVQPPIIVSDISRPGPITVEWISYAQSLTKRPVKATLTGPFTMVTRSYLRADASHTLQLQQLALAIRDEIRDLEAAGIAVIQVAEPALREGLPLRRSDWDEYLQWAIGSFKLATAGVGDETQIHSHVCYSDFGDILPSIKRLDVDVISITSNEKLWQALREHGYSNQIGPGVYDTLSPRIPSEQEIRDRLKEALEVIPSRLLFVNPDCTLKTRTWPQIEAALTNMVAAARWARQEYP